MWLVGWFRVWPRGTLSLPARLDRGVREEVFCFVCEFVRRFFGNFQRLFRFTAEVLNIAANDCFVRRRCMRATLSS